MIYIPPAHFSSFCRSLQFSLYISYILPYSNVELLNPTTSRITRCTCRFTCRFRRSGKCSTHGHTSLTSLSLCDSLSFTLRFSFFLRFDLSYYFLDLTLLQGLSINQLWSYLPMLWIFPSFRQEEKGIDLRSSL